MNNTAITPAIESGHNNVVFLPTAGTNAESASMPHGAKTSASSYDQKDCPPKEDTDNVGKFVGTSSDQQPTLEYRRKNYPGEYKRWDNMKQRCRTDKAFLDPRFEKFKDFMSHMGPMRHPDDSVDRIDHNNPEYGPDNCRWASKKLQTANRSITRYLTDHTDLRLSADEWSTRGPRIPAKTILHRVDVLGYSEHEAVHLKLYARRKTSPPISPPTSGEVNCKAGKQKGLTVDEHCEQQQWNVKDGDLYGRPKIMSDLLATSLATSYDTPIFIPQGKHKKWMKEFYVAMESAHLDYIEVFAFVIENWGSIKSGFCKYACERTAEFDPPDIPDLYFLSKTLNPAANFYVVHEKSAEAKKQRAAIYKKQQRLTEKKKQYIDDFVRADKKVKKAEKKCRKHLAKKDLPDNGVTDKDEEIYKERRYHPDGWTLNPKNVWEVVKDVLRDRCIKAHWAARSQADEEWEHKQEKYN